MDGSSHGGEVAPPAGRLTRSAAQVAMASSRGQVSLLDLPLPAWCCQDASRSDSHSQQQGPGQHGAPLADMCACCASAATMRGGQVSQLRLSLLPAACHEQRCMGCRCKQHFTGTEQGFITALMMLFCWSAKRTPAGLHSTCTALPATSPELHSWGEPLPTCTGLGGPLLLATQHLSAQDDTGCHCRQQEPGQPACHVLGL